MAGTLQFAATDAEFFTLVLALDAIGRFIERLWGGGGHDPEDREEVERIIEGLQKTQRTIEQINRAIDRNPEVAGNLWTAMVTGREPPPTRRARHRRHGRRANR